MKTVFRICVVAFLSVGAMSCTKSSSSGTSGIVTPPAPDTDPFIYSKINTQIAEPVPMQLGTESSIVHPGDRVTIFVPYSLRNETFAYATITMADKLTNEPIRTYDMISSEYASSSEIVLPENMGDDNRFFFVTFVVDGSYANKSITLKSKLQGQITSSSDELIGAFTVIP